MSMFTQRILTLSILATLCALTGCQTAAGTAIRAIWVTRADFVTADDVVEVMDNCQRGGFNTILFQVRGNGTAFYESKFEPWAVELAGKSTGFDPLRLAITQARSRGMQLHAWVNVMPAWRGPDEPEDRSQLYHAHPEWFWYDARGVRQPMVHRVGDRTRAWYVSLNPCLPQVRRYLVDVFREIVANYEIDGLHLDYIRFPNEPVIPGEKIPDYPRDARTLALFERETGATPDGDPARWNRWRTAKVTELVADIHAMVQATRPGAVLSAAVGTNRRRSMAHHRDATDWVERDIVDAVYPMNYKRDLATFQKGLVMWTPTDRAMTVVPGLWIDSRLATTAGTRIAAQQIRAAIDATGNFCLFAYHRLFDSPRDDKLTPDARSRVRAQRAERRRELLPFLETLR
jgi:uncharacterized lipoprotein YddW (UPF0748 family)